MSKKKLTPLMKFKETIKMNEDAFVDKGLYQFLLEQADIHIVKEEKAITKAFDKGVIVGSYDESDRGKDYYNERYVSLHPKKMMLSATDVINILQSENALNVEQPKKIPTEDKSTEDVVEKKEEISTEQKIENILLEELKSIGIEPKSIKVIKL